MTTAASIAVITVMIISSLISGNYNVTSYIVAHFFLFPYYYVTLHFEENFQAHRRR